MISKNELQELAGDVLVDLVIKQFTRETDKTAEVIQNELNECLKYLYLISKCQGKLEGLFLPVEQLIDEIWHYLIIQTMEYRELCHRLPGGFFVHHRSIPFEEYAHDNTSREQIINEFLVWVPLYVENFGPFTEETANYWTIVNFLNKDFGMSLGEINKLKETELE